MLIFVVLFVLFLTATRYVQFCIDRIKLFKHCGVTPYFVFDGDYLPSKAATESSREARRETSKKAGQELLKAGKPARAHEEFRKAIDVTPEMARLLIEHLKKENIPYVVAPYEADAQLVYLERRGLISGIVSEDSDLLVFGAKRLLTKLGPHGECIEINRKDFCAVREISLTHWTDTEFRHMAILSGCDYLAGLPGIGLKTAYRMIRKHKTPERVVKMLQLEGKTKIPECYLADFKQADQTFLYQRVFCPIKRDIVHLTEPDASTEIEAMPFIGAPVDTLLTQSIAAGDVNPITKLPIVLPPSPGKRRISQVFASTAPAKKPPGKPIDEYFPGHRRIALGEMDPNCFTVDGNVTHEAARPVIPLPRPYLDGTGTSASPPRPYKKHTTRRQSEPISKLLGSFDPESVSPRHRRRTAGPLFQVYHDSSVDPSMRPPKKARLCEDQTAKDADGVHQSPERSRFFSHKPPKKPGSKKARESFLMSDDSFDEAFRNLPDIIIASSSTKSSSRRASREIEASWDILADEEALPSLLDSNNRDAADDDVEVPASSPLQKVRMRATEQGKSETPRSSSGLLQKFSYTSSTSATKIIHGLPTPASSMQKPAGSATHLSTPSAAMLTPLQRIGSQALHRGAKVGSGSMLPTPKRTSMTRGSRPKPSSVPLPKVDLDEVGALNGTCGSEDQIIPDSGGEESDAEDSPAFSEKSRRGEGLSLIQRLDLSRFLYS